MLNFIRYIHQQILNRDEHNKSMSVIVGEDADVYGDVESEECKEPARRNKAGNDPTFPGDGDGDGYDDADVLTMLTVAAC